MQYQLDKSNYLLLAYKTNHTANKIHISYVIMHFVRIEIIVKNLTYFEPENLFIRPWLYISLSILAEH